MNKQCIHTDKAPAAVGPYSQAVVSGDLVFLSGQIPLDPATGSLVTGGIEMQTRQVIDNIRAVLSAAGCRPEDVCKTTVFLTDLGTFSAVNAIYADLFPKDPPARSTIEVAGLPLGAAIEIELVARRAG